MRERLMQILANDERDQDEAATTDPVLLRFWGRAKPLGARDAQPQKAAARVVDLAEWSRRRFTARS